LATFGTVSNKGNSVIKVSSTSRTVEDTTVVKLEYSLVSLNGDRDWLLGKSSLGLGGTSWGGVDVVADIDTSVFERVVHARSISGSVWVAVSVDGLVVFVVVESSLLETSIATEVQVSSSSTVNELLLRELRKGSSGDVVSSLQSTNR